MSADSLALKLEAVLEGALPLESVLADSSNFEDAVENCFHGLQHFLADADIRVKDSSYRLMQENEMRRLIRLLRSGADGKALAKITFLGASGG